MQLKLKSYPNTKDWLKFIDKALLISGALSITIGIIFFIAYNWANMGKFFKIPLVEFSLIAAFLTYYFSKNPLISKTALYIFAILIGALLALIGQIYQMGADSYELFLYWALFVTPFALINQDKTLWLIVIILLNISLALYNLIGGLNHIPWFSNKLTPIFIFNAFALFIWEIFRIRLTNCYNSWQRAIVILLCNFSLIAILVNTKVINFLLFLPYFIIIYLYYFKRKDLTILTPTAITFLIYILIAIGKIIDWHHFWFLGLLLLATTTLLLGGYLIKTLQNIAGDKR